MAIPALIAPLLSQGMALLGNAVLAKGKDWLEEATGVDVSQPLSQDDILKLRQFELEHEQELIRLRVEDKRLDYADTQSARDMNTRINESVHATWLAKNIPAVLSLIVVGIGFWLLASTEHADVRTAVIGLMTLVLGFYFGSSSTSKIKDDTINAITRDKL